MLLTNSNARSWRQTTFTMVRLLSVHFQNMEYLAFLGQKLYRLSSRHREYPNAVTSLANTIYNSIPKIYINSLQLMQQKRAQYRQGRSELAHPRVTKANFISYLEAVHKNEVAFLEPIGDLEVDDEWAGKAHLFDVWYRNICGSVGLWLGHDTWLRICCSCAYGRHRTGAHTLSKSWWGRIPVLNQSW